MRGSLLKSFSLCGHSGGGRVYIRDTVGWFDRSHPRELQTQRHAGFRRDVNVMLTVLWTTITDEISLQNYWHALREPIIQIIFEKGMTLISG